MSVNLIEAINKLERDQALEAARFLCQSLVGDELVDEGCPELQLIAEQPYAHLPDVESLARLVLISSASVPGSMEQVRKAIAGTGRKQFILGGAEIVALAALAVVALNIVVRGGHGRTAESLTLLDVDGKPFAKIEKVDEPISISSELAGILRSLKLIT
jgi:hypothetical protein